MNAPSLRLIAHCHGGFRVGMGHVVRLGALLQELGPDVEIVACIDEALARPHFPPDVRYCPPTLDAVASELSGPALAGTAPSLVVLDLPEYGAEFSVLGGTAAVTLAVDDGWSPEIAPDIVVNPSDYLRTRSYPKLPPHAFALRGLPYAMLRRPFRFAETRSVRDREFGFVIGSGPQSAQWVLEIIENLDTRGMDEVPMVVPTAFPNLAAVQAKAAARGIVLRAGLDADEMREFYSRLKLCVMTGGTAILEAMACATPVLCYPILDPMLEETRQLAEMGVLLVLSRDRAWASDLRALIETFLADERRLRQIGTEAGRLVDGQGAGRVASVILGVAEALQAGATKAEAIAGMKEAP